MGIIKAIFLLIPAFMICRLSFAASSCGRELPSTSTRANAPSCGPGNRRSLIHAGQNTYSVPSRLIGEKVEVRLCVEHVEVWYDQQEVERFPRLCGRKKRRTTTGTSSTDWCDMGLKQLTMGVYTHINLNDQSSAIELLPAPPELRPSPKALGAKVVGPAGANVQTGDNGQLDALWAKLPQHVQAGLLAQIKAG